MKKLLFLLLALGCLSNCQSTENERSVQATVTMPVNGIDPEIGDGTFEYDPVMATVKLQDMTSQKQSELFALSKTVRKRATDLRPFPVLKADKKPMLSVEEADARYRVNAEKLVNDIALQVYQQKYAKRMFVDYKLLESTDYARTEYYTNQLLDGHSMDDEIISVSMQRLESHVTLDNYKSMLKRATQAAEKHLSIQQKAIEAFEKRLMSTDVQNRQATNPQQIFWQREAQKSIDKMKKSRLSEQVNQLHELERAIQ